jgi:hypothetical protein
MEADRTIIREIIESQGSKIVSVEFLKKDGSYRKMLVQYAVGAQRVLGEHAEASHAIGAITRRMTSPHLMNVWDIQKDQFRSIDLDRVFNVTGSGTTLYSRPVEEVLDLRGVA